MNYAKIVSISTSTLMAIVQAVIGIVVYFKPGFFVGLTLWQLYAPGIWVASWSALWFIAFLGKAAWRSYEYSRSRTNTQIARAMLLRKTRQLRSEEGIDSMSRRAIRLRAEINELNNVLHPSK